MACAVFATFGLIALIALFIFGLSKLVAWVSKVNRTNNRVDCFDKELSSMYGNYWHDSNRRSIDREIGALGQRVYKLEEEPVPTKKGKS